MTVLEQDDLFAAPPIRMVRPSEGLTTTRCVVCDLGYVAVQAPAKLCGLCLEDLDATRAHITHGIDAVLARLDKAKAAWAAALAASPAQTAWSRVEAAMIAVAEKRITQSALDATWAKRKSEGGPLATLLEAYERYAADTDQCGVELQHWHRAQVEVNAAWMANDL